MSQANQRQVGGSHYKVGGEEHWDRVVRLKLDYFQAQITKYIERAPHKNRKEDVEKALHFCEKYLEVFDKMYPVIELAEPGPGYVDQDREVADHSFDKGNIPPEHCSPQALCNRCGKPKWLHPSNIQDGPMDLSVTCGHKSSEGWCIRSAGHEGDHQFTSWKYPEPVGQYIDRE